MDLMEELALAKKRIAKRRIMEAQVQQQGGSGGGNGGGRGEVRRVHIIYFLSRKGRVEHPHLVRVHHLSRNGVRLRDVKRWLTELRGKDMPDSFAWSYKRKYKAGYVWQDLLDEDLITPISDNEYVLKGSEIASSTFNDDKYLYGEKEASTKKSIPQEDEGTKEQKALLNDEKRDNPESPLVVSTKTSFEIEEESPLYGSETSSLTDDSSKHEKDRHSSITSKKEEENDQRDEKENHNGYASRNKNKKGDDVNDSASTSFKKSSSPTSNSSVSNPSIGKSSGYFGGPSHMFRNWITCGTVDTNESAVLVLNRRGSRSSLGVYPNKENHSKKSYKGGICKEDKLGGSERISAHSWLLEQQHIASGRKSLDERMGSKKSKTDEFNDRKAIPSAYKPVNRPKCSQCGRQFKPEKLHTHMKSCRGMKAMAKGSSASPRTSEKTRLRTAEAPSHGSTSSYYLTDK